MIKVLKCVPTLSFKCKKSIGTEGVSCKICRKCFLDTSLIAPNLHKLFGEYYKDLLLSFLGCFH